MKPHPKFKDYNIPLNFEFEDVILKALNTDDLERDFNAIMESATEIKAANPSLAWPDGLTREKNLIDLSWHQREFEAKRSFAWVIEDKTSNYLGCLYIYPSIEGEDAADVKWWWRTGIDIDRTKFRENLASWLKGQDWPLLHYKMQKQ